MPSGVALDGSKSSDPDDDALRYAWSVTGAPDGSAPRLADANSARAVLFADAPGAYTVALRVTDAESASDMDEIVVELTNSAPAAAASASDYEVAVQDEVLVSAADTADVNGQTLSYRWALTEKPAESSIADDHEGEDVLFAFDVPGTYALRLTVSDGFEEDVVDLDPIIVEPWEIYALGRRPSDAAWDETTGQLVALFDDELLLVADDDTRRSVFLPRLGTALAVSPENGRAVVSHDGFVSLIDLEAGGLVETFAVPARLDELVFVGADRVGAFSAGAGDGFLLDLSTGVVKSSEVFFGSVEAAAHPQGGRVYAISLNSFPTDIMRTRVDNGVFDRATDSPYHGDYPMSPGLWISPDGSSLLTGAGTVFRASEIESLDMQYRTTLPLRPSARLADGASSAATGAWTVIETESYSGDIGDLPALQRFDLETGARREDVPLPSEKLTGAGAYYPARVFTGAENAALVVVATDAADQEQHYAVLARGRPHRPSLARRPSASIDRYAAATVGVPLTLEPTVTPGEEGETLSYRWTRLAQPDGAAAPATVETARLSFTPAVSGLYRFEFVAIGQAGTSLPLRVDLVAAVPGEPAVHRLSGIVADAEYSTAIDALVMLTGEGRTLTVLPVSTRDEQVVPLDADCRAVGVAPNGLEAALSCEGEAVLVDLEGMAVFDRIAIPPDTSLYPDERIGDVVVDHEGDIHIAPRRDQWVDLLSIDRATGNLTATFGLYAGTMIRMHPTENWIYGADNGLSPSDFEKFTTGPGLTARIGDSPYHGAYTIGGNLWLAKDGDSLLVRGGGLFRVSADNNTDMTYLRALADDVSITWADHNAALGRWAVIGERSWFTADPALDGQLLVYEDSFLGRVGTIPVEDIPTAVGPVAATPRYVFFTADGSHAVAITEADEEADSFAVQIDPRVP